VQRYASRQLDLMNGGLTEAEARSRMDADIAEAVKKLVKMGKKDPARAECEALASMAPPPRTRKFIPAVQEEEEEVVKRVLALRKANPESARAPAPTFFGRLA